MIEWMIFFHSIQQIYSLMIKHYILKAKCVGGNVSNIETCMTEHKWNQNVNVDWRQKCFEEKKIPIFVVVIHLQLHKPNLHNH